MGWLNLILEDILNEVKAEDAYSRFYNKMPREDFDAITRGKEDLDKVDQYFLNCVRDDYASKEDVVDIIDKLTNEENKQIVTQIVNDIKHNQYDFPQVIPFDMNFIKKYGAKTLKGLEKQYVKIAENDNWIASSVFTHAASNHYFGHTHWCTAANNDGRWFRRYTIEDLGPAALIQFTNKNDKNETYQIQCYTDGRFGDSKDAKDHNFYPDQIKKKVGSDLFKEATSSEVVNKCYELTEKYAKEELGYKEELNERGRIIERGKSYKNSAVKRKLEIKAKEFNESQDLYNQRLCEKIKSEKLLENIDFLNSLLDLNLEKYELYHNLLRNNNKDRLSHVIEGLKMSNNIIYSFMRTYKVADENNFNAFIEVYQVDGLLKRVAYGEDNSPFLEDYVSLENNGNLRRTFIVRIKDNKITEIESGRGYYPIKDCNMCLYHEGPEPTLRVLCTGEEIPIGNSNPEYIKQSFARTNYNTKSPNEYNIVYDDSYKTPFVFIFDNKEEKCLKQYHNVTTHNYHLTKIFCLEQNLFWLYNSGSFSYIVKTPNMDEDTFPIYAESIYGKNDYCDVIINYNNGNVCLLSRPQKFIFSEGSRYCYTDKIGWGSEQKIYLRAVLPNHKEILYDINKKFYYTYNENNEKVMCDINGDTSQNAIMQKNFADWQAQGGHSPEVKAQMDKMWADRNMPNRSVDNDVYEKDRVGKDFYASKNAANMMYQDLMDDPEFIMDMPAKDNNGYFRTSSDIDKPGGEDPRYKHGWKKVYLDKNGHDIPDWSTDDEDAVAQRNRDRFKEVGISESVKKMFRMMNILND